MRSIAQTALLLLLLGCTGKADAQAPDLIDACAGEFTREALVNPANQEQRPNLALYVCKGGLFLIDTEQSQPLLRINPSWWLEALADSSWNADGTVLTVTASFATGIGPTGAQPFTWQFAVSEDESGAWQTQELEPGASEYVVEADGMVEIRRPEQLSALGLTAYGKPYTVDVDFNADRLIVKSLWLTSGDLEINNVRVYRSQRAYFVTYSTRGPALGSADMQQAIIYLIVPKDVRYVSFEDPEHGARRFDARTGVIPRGTFVGAPTP
jgi:hypothetical protein